MATLMDLIMQQVGGRAPVTPTPERQQMFDTLSSYGAGMPISQPPPAARPVPMPMLVGQPMPSMPQPMPQPMPAAPMPPMPPPRPAAAPMQIAPTPAAPSVREGFMKRLLGGPNYQSNNMPVVMSPQGPMASGGFLPQSVNWGDPESAADFFRADQAARQLGLLG